LGPSLTISSIGSLGIPGAVWWDHIKRLLGRPSQRDELKFYDTDLAPNVENAFQALAMDEMRYSYEPAVWEKQPHIKTVSFPWPYESKSNCFVET
jgi:Uncharacterized alpha/beta hydrolase domain (DUF2235)